MRSLTRWLWGPALLCLGVQAHGETVTKTVTFDGADVKGQPYSLGEVGALVAQTGDEFKVLFVMEAEHRPEAYRHVDLRAEDRILMINGKKVTSLEMLSATLDSAAVGGEIQLGIKRDKDMLIVRFPKADPKTLPQMKRMMVTDVQGGPGEGEGTFVSKGGDGEHVAVLKGAGLVVRQDQAGLEIMYLLPPAAAIEALGTLKEGDHVVSLQGKKVTELAALEAAWNAIATGDPVKLVCSRDKDEKVCSFAKPDPAKDKGGAVMITK